MGTDAVSALVCGRLFDRSGMSVLIIAALLAALFAPLVFLGGFALAVLGMALWGIGMGVQESVVRAVVAGMVSSDRRASAYGLFDAGYGIAWFLGSALMGILYDRSLPALIVFSLLAQLLSIPLLLVVARRYSPSSAPAPTAR
jgi:MFS family permease